MLCWCISLPLSSLMLFPLTLYCLCGCLPYCLFCLLEINLLYPQGKHTLNIKATMQKGSAEVNGVPSLQPPADQVYTTRVVFNLVEGKAVGPSVEPSDPKAAAGAGDKAAAAAPGDKAGAADAPAAAEGKEEVKAPAAAEGEAKPAEEKKKGPGGLAVGWGVSRSRW